MSNSSCAGFATRVLKVLAVVLLGAVAGCGSGEEVGVVTPAEAATQLDQAFAVSEPEVQQNMRVASEALREGRYEQAVVALEVTRASTNLTLEQGMAVHDSMVALEQNLLNAVAAGDPKARRAYDLLKRAKRN